MNLQSFKGTPDSLKLRFKGFERKLRLGAPEDNMASESDTIVNCNYLKVGQSGRRVLFRTHLGQPFQVLPFCFTKLAETMILKQECAQKVLFFFFFCQFLLIIKYSRIQF